jgi:pyrimidine-specific ribonucleoside hydrolase
MMKIPVIIDCDPGVDDALAILLALASDKLEVRAITTVAGNQTIAKTTANALRIVDFLGAGTKVAAGAAKPLQRELKIAEWVHGASGLGKADLPPARRLAADPLNAVNLIWESVRQSQEKTQLIALGPLTNLAILLSAHPGVREKLAGITLMGGSCFLGNTTPAAEFNIHCDPEAAKIVFESGLPITMIGLDATRQAVVYESEIAEIVAIPSRVGKFVGDLFRSTLEVCRFFGAEGAVMHDLLAVAQVINPQLVKTQAYRVEIETSGEFTTGKTVVDRYNVWNREPNARVGLEVNRPAFLEMIKEMMVQYGI